MPPPNIHRINSSKAKAGPPTAPTLFPGNGSSLRAGSVLTRRPAGNRGGGGIFTKLMFYAFLTFTYMSFWRTLTGVSNNGSNAPVNNNNKIATTLQKTHIGSLGPSGSGRQHLRYYDSLFYTALQYGADATSSIEVGFSSEPFLQHLDWIDRRTCVAPYFDQYEKTGGTNNTAIKIGDKNNENGNGNGKSTNKIEMVTADFMKYQPPTNQKKFDLLLCSQVLEHVPDPSAFMKKLISTATKSIISVPYDWKPCGKTCNHVTDHISYKTLLEWSKPHVPVYSGVVAERHLGKEGTQVKRMILVYKPDEEEGTGAGV